MAIHFSRFKEARTKLGYLLMALSMHRLAVRVFPSAWKADELKTTDQDDGDKGYGEPPEPRRVKWLMHYSDDREEMIFEDRLALAALLITEKVFLNSHWWKEDWPEDARQSINVLVNCNDVFAWGCADCETLPYDELESLWDYHVKDPAWGTEVWCIVRRKEMPQKPVEKYLREGGIWDLDALRSEHGLRANHYDGVCGVRAQRKYAAYCAWERTRGNDPRSFDARWWAGWDEYTDANPGWCSEEWKAADDAAVEEWRSANGWDEETPVEFKDEPKLGPMT